VEEFLRILYLAEREGAPSLGPLFTCLVEGASSYLAASAPHKHESNVKAEKKTDKTSAEIKMEEADMKIKKKLECAGQNGVTDAGGDGGTGTELLGDPSDEITTRPLVSARKSEVGAFKCSTCDKVFRVRRVLNMHEQIHREPRLACPEPGCTRRFRKRFNLKAHVDVVHRNAKHFPCELCGKQFYNESKLKAHAVCHSADKFICQHCPSIFAAAKSLRSHIRSHHSTEEMVPRCVTCGKVFSTEMNLRSHVSRVHLKEKRCECPTCGKLFFENRQLGNSILLMYSTGTLD
jgi:hypothetical protein